MQPQILFHTYSKKWKIKIKNRREVTWGHDMEEVTSREIWVFSPHQLDEGFVQCNLPHSACKKPGVGLCFSVFKGLCVCVCVCVWSVKVCVRVFVSIWRGVFKLQDQISTVGEKWHESWLMTVNTALSLSFCHTAGPEFGGNPEFAQ